MSVDRKISAADFTSLHVYNRAASAEEVKQNSEQLAVQPTDEAVALWLWMRKNIQSMIKKNIYQVEIDPAKAAISWNERIYTWYRDNADAKSDWSVRWSVLDADGFDADVFQKQ